MAPNQRPSPPLPLQDEEESAGDRTGGGGMVEPYQVLGEASIVLRDPSAMHLLSAAVLQVGARGRRCWGRREGMRVGVWVGTGDIGHVGTTGRGRPLPLGFSVERALPQVPLRWWCWREGRRTGRCILNWTTNLRHTTTPRARGPLHRCLVV